MRTLAHLEQSDFRDGIIKVSTLLEDLAKAAVKDLSAVHWTPSTVGQKHDVFRVKELVDVSQRNALSAGVDKASELADNLLKNIKPVVCDLIEMHWKVKISYHSGLQFTRYEAGHFIRLHKDSGAAYPDRLFSVVTYLRDDYTGGEIFFSQSGKRFHPKIGETLVFPCDFAHGVDEIIDGTKEIFLFFLDRNPTRIAAV